MKQVLVAVVLLLLTSGTAVAGPLNDAAAADKRGDFEEAFKFWRLAAEEGSGLGQALLGSAYSQGRGTPKNHLEAVKWFRMAAEQGVVLGQLGLGRAYLDGEGVPQDYSEATRWFRLAAEQGSARGQTLLGRSYFLGVGMPQDYVLAHMWLNLAAAKGQERALEYRDQVIKEMTPEQIAEAQRMAREWTPKQ